MLVKVKPPRYPLGQLVSWELRNYRAELEQALTSLPEQSAEHTLYAGRLAEVITEQESRERESEVPPRWDGVT